MNFVLVYALAITLMIAFALALHVYSLTLKLKVASMFVQFVKEAPVGTGACCCCGDSMDKHTSPYYSNHAPLDEWDRALNEWVETLEKEGIYNANN